MEHSSAPKYPRRFYRIIGCLATHITFVSPQNLKVCSSPSRTQVYLFTALRILARNLHGEVSGESSITEEEAQLYVSEIEYLAVAKGRMFTEGLDRVAQYVLQARVKHTGGFLEVWG